MSEIENPHLDDSRPAWLELSIAYRYWIGAGIAASILAVVVAILAFGWSPPEISLNQPTKVFLFGAILAAALGALPAAKIIDWLHDPPKRYIVNLGMKESEDPSIYELSPSAWNSIYVADGELYQWDNTDHPVYEAESFDPEQLIAWGTWRGSLPDSDLLEREKEIEELRETLEKQADMSIDLELSISSRVRKAVKAIGQAIIQEHAEATIYEGEQVSDVLSEIRQDVEEDAGEDSPIRSGSGDVPVTSKELEAAVDGLQEAASKARADGGETDE